MVRLDRVDRRQLHAAFQEAFADYAVDMSSLTEEKLQIRFTKNGVDWDASIGAFAGDRMVGFTIIGIDECRGGLAAFDAATGIVRGFRGQGLAQQIFEQALPGLRQRGVERFVLEVMVDNEPAIRAYEKTGFVIRRRLGCFGLDLVEFRARKPAAPADSIRVVDREELQILESWIDWQPSWENSFGALARIPEELLTLGAFHGDECVGGIAYSPAMNWIMTLVVRPSYRRRGIASALVGRLVEDLALELELIKLLNVDSADSGMLAFLEALGFHHLVDQFEMERPV
jgi:ribosomal protein S18 acetylase RimI-like enzyme